MALMGRRLDRVAQDAPPSTPERTALQLAWERAQAARRARDGAAAAEGPARAAVSAAKEKVEDAAAAVEAAKAEAGRRAAASFATGDVLETPTALRQARAALVEAEDDLVIAISARDSLNGRQMTDTAAVNDAEHELKTAIAGVIRAEISAEALGAEIVATQRQLADRIAALEWLIRNAGALPRVQEHGPRFGEVADEGIYDALFRATPGNTPLPGKQWGDLKAASSSYRLLEAAAAALERDATAPVPKIGA